MKLGKLKAYPYTWRNGSQETPGVALRAGDKIISHLSWAEAEALAERIFDLLDEKEAA